MGTASVLTNGGGTVRIIRWLIILSLTSLIMGLVPGEIIRAASSIPPAPAQVDRQVWANLAAAPGHQVRFVVSMREKTGEGAASAIPAQIALEQPLAFLQRVGCVSSVVAYYGANIIVVDGGPGAVRFLSDWPGVASIGPYLPGNSWE